MAFTPKTALASATLAAMLAAPGALWAQAQPPAAVNNQDERINLNKTVGEDVSEFRIFRSGDKSELNNYVTEVVELKNAVALEVLPYVLAAVESEKGTAKTLKYKDPDGTERYFLQIVTTERQMPSVLRALEQIDLPGVESSSGDIKYHLRMNYRRASETAAVLRGTTLSGEGKVYADDVTNTIYISDSVSDGMRDIIVAQFYDVPPPQVEFEVLAVEIEEENDSKVGLDWDAWKTALGGQFNLTGNTFEGGDTFARLDSLVTVDAEALASFLSYTSQNGNAQIVTRSKLTASNDRPGILSSLRRLPNYEYERRFQDAKILVEEVPGVSTRFEEGRDDEGQYTNYDRTVSIRPWQSAYLVDKSAGSMRPGASALDPSLSSGEKAEGVYLEIFPTIAREMVTADVRMVVNSLVGYTRLNDPIITERLIETQSTLKDGEPFSLGAIDKETKVQVTKGIPGLKSLPVLEYVFGV